MKIVCDSREQRALWNSNVIRKKLDVGDYSVESMEKKIAIERKSAIDICGTLGKDHKRFKKELERAKKLDYFAIVIEESYMNIKNMNFDGADYTQMKGSTVLSILATIHIKYAVPIFFTNGRVEARELIKSLLRAYMSVWGNKLEVVK